MRHTYVEYSILVCVPHVSGNFWLSDPVRSLFSRPLDSTPPPSCLLYLYHKPFKRQSKMGA